jgi:hypothetical protein
MRSLVTRLSAHNTQVESQLFVLVVNFLTVTNIICIATTNKFFYAKKMVRIFYTIFLRPKPQNFLCYQDWVPGPTQLPL